MLWLGYITHKILQYSPAIFTLHLNTMNSTKSFFNPVLFQYFSGSSDVVYDQPPTVTPYNYPPLQAGAKYNSSLLPVSGAEIVRHLIFVKTLQLQLAGLRH